MYLSLLKSYNPFMPWFEFYGLGPFVWAIFLLLNWAFLTISLVFITNCLIKKAFWLLGFDSALWACHTSVLCLMALSLPSQPWRPNKAATTTNKERFRLISWVWRPIVDWPKIVHQGHICKCVKCTHIIITGP